MIFIIWFIIIVLDSLAHSIIIKKGININHIIAGSYRIVIAILLFWWLGVHDLRHFSYYLFGAFFSFWLLFNLLLNKWRGLNFDYLGKGSLLDRIEGVLPFPYIAIFKAILSIGLIGIYYTI